MTEPLTDAEAYSIYEAIDFRDHQWTPEATAAVERIIASRVAAYADEVNTAMTEPPPASTEEHA